MNASWMTLLALATRLAGVDPTLEAGGLPSTVGDPSSAWRVSAGQVASPARHGRIHHVTPPGSSADRARSAVAATLPAVLGRLGEATVTETHERVAVSFELLGPDRAPVFERRLSVVLDRAGVARRVHFDGLPVATPSAATVRAEVAVSAATALGRAGDARAGWLPLALGPLEPVWRVPVVVMPFVDHRWLYVSRVTGLVVRSTQSALQHREVAR